MDRVSIFTHLDPPHKELVPHVSFHRPISGIPEEVVLDLTQSIALQVRETRIRVGNIDRFGKHYIVLPVYATRSMAGLWVGLTQALSTLSEYEHGQFDGDNTLHITIAKKVSAIFDEAWPNVRGVPVEEMEIPVEKVAVYKKAFWEGARWERLEEFHLRN